VEFPNLPPQGIAKITDQTGSASCVEYEPARSGDGIGGNVGDTLR
jgi:hypothetical protein